MRAPRGPPTLFNSFKYSWNILPKNPLCLHSIVCVRDLYAPGPSLVAHFIAYFFNYTLRHLLYTMFRKTWNRSTSFSVPIDSESFSSSIYADLSFCLSAYFCALSSACLSDRLVFFCSAYRSPIFLNIFMKYTDLFWPKDGCYWKCFGAVQSYYRHLSKLFSLSDYLCVPPSVRPSVFYSFILLFSLRIAIFAIFWWNTPRTNAIKNDSDRATISTTSHLRS